MAQPKEHVGTRKDPMLYRFQTAESNLKSARILFAADEYKGANNRAYYAIFHVMRAILVFDNFDSSKHSGSAGFTGYNKKAAA